MGNAPEVVGGADEARPCGTCCSLSETAADTTGCDMTSDVIGVMWSIQSVNQPCWCF